MNISAPWKDDAACAPADRQLRDSVQRSLRAPAGRMALVLHLSRLTPPAPRAHHRRIARALLTDTAGRFDGQVFVRPCGDLVLLCRTGHAATLPAGPALPGRATQSDPTTLPESLARLLRVDAPHPAPLVSLWRLDQDAAGLLAYLDTGGRALEAPPSPDDDLASQTTLVDAISAVVTQSSISDLMQRQTAILLPGGGGDGLVPIYREVTFSIAALQARITNAGHVGTDPFLFRHLATRLDRRMLSVLTAAIGRGGPLDAAEAGEPGRAAAAAALHLNLTVPGILSPAFQHFAAACRVLSAPVGVEVSIIEAAADPAGFARARSRVAEAGLTLVLDGVSHLALLLTRPGRWQPDLLKLDWSPRMIDLPALEARQLDIALAEIGEARLVLHRAETEAAVRWGMSHGIRRFQGRHIDAMLGAARIVACPHASGCTLRQCIERSAATGPAGRSGCRNQALLNAAAPAPMALTVLRHPLHTGVLT